MIAGEIKKVLLADDDADDRYLFEHAYNERQDIHLLPSLVNGAAVIDALNKTTEDGELPDLIILDQNMPKMTGKQTLMFIKTSERFAHIAVCICSTYADHDLINDCLRLGAYEVASKPITEEEYQKMMDSFLKGAPSRASGIKPSRASRTSS